MLATAVTLPITQAHLFFGDEDAGLAANERTRAALTKAAQELAGDTFRVTSGGYYFIIDVPHADLALVCARLMEIITECPPGALTEFTLKHSRPAAFSPDAFLKEDITVLGLDPEVEAEARKRQASTVGELVELGLTQFRLEITADKAVEARLERRLAQLGVHWPAEAFLALLRPELDDSTIRFLQSVGVHTVNRLEELTKEDLAGLGCGRHTVTEIEDAMKAHGRSLKNE